MKDLPFIIELKLLAHGIVGALVRVLVLREYTWPDGVISLLVGGLSAPYLGPALTPLIMKTTGLMKEEALPLAGFVAGIAGVLLIGGLLDYIRAKVGGTNDEPSKARRK